MKKKIFLLLAISIIAMSCLTACDDTSDSNTEKTVTCPSCGKEVSSLKRREIFKGNGDWKEWCYDCWDEYDSLSPYDYE